MGTSEVAFPDKKYGIIYADPPWQYNDKLDKARRLDYATMTTHQLMLLPVNKIAAKDCALFMWVTMPHLRQAFWLFDSWGFDYKTCAFTWVKTITTGRRPAWGMGHWTRSNAELCLLATKGKPKRIDASVHSVIISPAREHSRKPDEVRNSIVKLLGPLPRIELFARQKVDGWDAWGNEAPLERERTLLD